MEAYLKDDGMPDDFIATLVSEMTMQWKFTDSGYEMTEWFGGGLKVKTCGNFDEEVDYVFPVEGAETMKYVTTKIGNGKYKAFIKQANGNINDWTFDFTGDEIKMVRHFFRILQTTIFGSSSSFTYF